MSLKKLLRKTLAISVAAMLGWLLGLWLDNTDPLINAIGTWVGFTAFAIFVMFMIWNEKR